MVSWSQPKGAVGNLNPGCFINPTNTSDLNQYQFPDPNPMTFQVGSVYQIDFYGAPTTRVACMPVVSCCAWSAAICMPVMQERPADASSCAVPVAADQAFHPGHLHENPMQIYFINRTILGANTTLTNYWQARSLLTCAHSRRASCHTNSFIISLKQLQPYA